MHLVWVWFGIGLVGLILVHLAMQITIKLPLEEIKAQIPTFETPLRCFRNIESVEKKEKKTQLKSFHWMNK